MNLYFDNAATSFPKPDIVLDSMYEYMKTSGGSYSRGAYSSSLEASRIVYTLREALANFFNFPTGKSVIINSGLTLSLNTLLKASIKEGWHVITSSMEHNSVLRPLKALQTSVKYDLEILKPNSYGLIDVNTFKSLINGNTKLAVFSYASNVNGIIQPLKDIGAVCKANNVFLVIDSAQVAGHQPIDYKSSFFSALAFSGHKSLLGPQGIGGFIIDETLNSLATSFIEGGTGSFSESLLQPQFLPDKFETGTINIPACLGLLKSIEFINKIGIDYVREYERDLYQQLINGLLQLKDINIVGYNSNYSYTPVVSITSPKISSSEIAFLLDKNFGISVRYGLHCAPLAHKSLGTFPQGTVRVSPGIYNTSEDVTRLLCALNNILKH